MATVVQDVSGDSALQTAIAALKAKIEGAEESGDISSLNEKISSVTDTSPAVYEFATKETGTTTLPDGWGTTPGYLRGMSLSNPGSLAGTTSASNNTFYYLALQDMDVYIEISASNDSNYPMPTESTPLHVEAGQYITMSYYNGSSLADSVWTVYAIDAGGNTTLKSTLPLTAEMESQVDAKIAEADKVMDTGYYHLRGQARIIGTTGCDV